MTNRTTTPAPDHFSRNATATIGADVGPPRLLLRPTEAARCLAISARKLWALTASGEVPHVRIGRSVRYPVADLETWLDEQTRGGSDR